MRHHLLGLLDLIPKLAQRLRDRRLVHDCVLAHAATDVVRVALHVARDLGLLHLAQGLAQLGRGLALGALQIAHGRRHALLEPFQVLDLALLLGSKRLCLLACGLGAVLPERLAHLAFELLLTARQIVGLPGQVFHLPRRLLAAHAVHHLIGFVQTLCRAARLRLTLRSSRIVGGRGVAHVLHGLIEVIQHLLQLLGIRPARLLSLIRLLLLLLLLRALLGALLAGLLCLARLPGLLT